MIIVTFRLGYGIPLMAGVLLLLISSTCMYLTVAFSDCYFSPRGLRSIVMNITVCVSCLCLSVCLSARISRKPH